MIPDPYTDMDAARRKARRHLVRGLIFTMLLIIAAVAFIVGASAAKADPTFNVNDHIPNPAVGWCPGGGDGGYSTGFCDGADYLDGSYWHFARGFIPFKGYTTTMFCAAAHDFMPPPAGPHGCGR